MWKFRRVGVRSELMDKVLENELMISVVESLLMCTTGTRLAVSCVRAHPATG